MAVDILGAHHRQPYLAQRSMLSLFHHRKEDRKMHNPSRIGITKLDAPFVDKGHDRTEVVSTGTLRESNRGAYSPLSDRYSPTNGINAMNRARLTAAVTACWLTAEQPLLRRPTIFPWRLTNLVNNSTSL